VLRLWFSSLAEFEIEYADKTSPTVDVAFAGARPGRSWLRPSIWPTLAQARLCGHLDHHAVDAAGQPGAEPQPERWSMRWWTPIAGCCMLAEALVDEVPGALRHDRAAVLATTTRRQARRPRASGHPLADVHPGYRRISPVYLADYATAEDGTGVVHSAPAYGVEDFNSCVAHGLKPTRS
jgi:isoleucyl-tRNA synthetase